MKKLVFSGLLALSLVVGTNVSAKEYRVLVIRVDFPYEEPDHSTTTGRGNFDLGNYYTDPEVHNRYYHPWDIPPHDSTYVSNHMRALDRYLRTVSEDRVSIRWSIWPKNQTGAYRMSKIFYKYGNGRTTEQTYEKLAGLFKEAVETCKTTESSGIDFSDYDTFIIIHAGVGRETSGALNDIPSAYLNEADFDTYLNGPLTVDGNPIANGIILPEMIAENGGGGLNGLMAQMFGHRLGLPSLSNNTDGIPAAGGWSLMDTGGLAYGYFTRGFIPTHPEMWSKVTLGWITPVTVTADTTLDIAATHINNGTPRAVRIPLTPDEYLLLENRERHASRDSMPENITFSDSDTSGVWTAVDHYDAFIPGSGILIWHINDRIVREGMPSGGVNDNRYRRGVDLLEADGVQDIGALSYTEERSNYAEGWEKDPMQKASGYRSTLSPLTEPNSGSMWGATSGVTIKVNSAAGDVMNVTITFATKQKQLTGVPCDAGRLTAADLDGDEADEIISTGEDSLAVISGSNGSASFLMAPWHPVVAPRPDTGANMLVLARKDSILFYDSNLSLITGVSLPDTVTAQPVYTKTATGGYILVPAGNSVISIPLASFPSCAADTIPTASTIATIAAEGDFFSALGLDGTLSTGSLSSGTVRAHVTITPETPAYGPVIADLDRDGNDDVMVTFGKRFITLQTDSLGALSVSDETALANEPAGEPALADIDRDGYPEIVLTTKKQVLAFRANGVPVTGFPHALSPGDTAESITTGPVVADLDRDGEPDIAFGTSDGRFVAYDPAGQSVNGYPVTLLGVPRGTPLIFRRDGSGAVSIAYGDTSGALFTRTLTGTMSDSAMAWPMWRGGAGLPGSLGTGDISSALKTTAEFEAFCYPNPVTGSTATFRIVPESATGCRITVFSADGKKVFDRDIPENGLIPGVPNEVTMDASRLASGLYVAKIQTKTRTKIYKLGVLK